MKAIKRTIFSFTFLLLFFIVSEVLAGQIHIAIAVNGQEQDAGVSQVAGRAPYFLFFDEHGNFLEAMQNPATDQPGGAGSAAAEFLAEHGVKTVIAGSFGNKMSQALKKHHIEHLEKKGAAYVVVQTIVKKQ